jgi:CDP-glycerol glycerophosphotransferase (TagB/SpsB family)
VSQRAFSIVVPVHNVRAYLRECLDSILNQSFRDFEVIAVDDASPDGSGAILDEYAHADPRVTVLHLENNVGLGRARDTAIAVATGRYLLFVDGDDTLTPDSLQAIADRIVETDDPDIVVFDYARTYWNGAVERNILGHLFAEAGGDVFTVEQRPEFLTLLMVVWNKAYRLDFVREHGFTFPVGYYEDIPWTYPTMLTARRIAALDRVAYHYRQRRHGNILRSSNRRHFDIFDQYGLVFAYLDAHPDLARWRPFMFDRMVAHLLQILVNRRRIAPALQREFFDAFADAYDRYRPSDYTLPAGRAGAKLRTVARRDFRAFQAADTVSQLDRKARRSVRRARTSSRRQTMRFKRGLVRVFYAVQRRQPIDENLAVYSAYWSRSYACNPAAIYEAAKRLAPHIEGVWVVHRDFTKVMPKGVRHVKLNSPEYYRVMARAKYFVNNVNFANNIVKRPGTVHVQTQHGTPLKTMGLELLDHPTADRPVDFDTLMRRSDRWDYVISSNRFSSEVWERSFPNSYVTLESGYPRNDRLVRATPDEKADLRKKLKLPANKTVILYAPTFRDWDRGSFSSPADLADLGERLGDRFVLLVRGHYLTENDGRLARLERRGLLRDVSAHPSIEELMIASDVLMTDYSSIMFDYGNLDRPIVIFAPDWDTYVRVRGVNFDLMAAPPGVVETTQPGLVDAFLSGRYQDARASALRKEFIQRFCEFDDGHAAERVVREIFLGADAAPAQFATGMTQDDAGPQGDDTEIDDAVEPTLPGEAGEGSDTDVM